MSRLPELFKSPATLNTLRPAAIQQHVQLHQQQRIVHVAEPQLLQKLYACLDTAAIQDALAPHTELQASAKQRSRRGLAAYHKVFELLLASLTTYKPLLLRIKHAYDEALTDAAEAACDNVYLHSKLSMVPHMHVSWCMCCL